MSPQLTQQQLDDLKPIETDPDTLAAMQQLIEDGRNDVARLPENLFVQNLLPVLTDRSGKVDIGVWLDIAGNGFRPIDVIAPNGEVMFRVPPLMTPIPTQVKRDSRHSLALLVEETNRRRLQHPAIGETFLRAQLAQRGVEQVLPIEQIRQWNTILVRYGHPPVIDLAKYDLPTEPGTAAASEPAPAATGALTAGDDQEDF